MGQRLAFEGNQRHQSLQSSEWYSVPTASARVLFAVSYMTTKLLLRCSHLLLQILTPGKMFLWDFTVGQGRAVWYGAAPTSGRFNHTGAFSQTVHLWAPYLQA